MATHLSFASSLARLPGRQNALFVKNQAVCVLEDRGARTSELAVPAKKKASVSPHYHVLPNNLDPKKLPPAPPYHWSIPFIGFIIEEELKISTTVSRARKYGKIYESDFFLGRWAIVTDMAAMIDMLRDVDIFRNKGSFEPFRLVFGDDNILNLDPPEHGKVRSMIAPAFSPAMFPVYFDSIRRRTKRTWARVAREVAEKDRLQLDPILREHYLSIIVEITTGIDMDIKGASSIREKFLILSKVFFGPPWGPIWNMGMKAKAELTEILENVVQKNIAEKSEMIEKLRKYGDKISYQDIKNEGVNVLLVAIAQLGIKTGPGEQTDPRIIRSLTNLILILWFAGYATSAATTSCAAFEMGMDDTIWEQLSEEQDSITAAAGSKEVTYSQVTSKMPLLDSFITEMLRMHPAAVGSMRVPSEDVEILGRLVKKGTPVLFDFKAAMFDPELYVDPEALKVDRFVRRPGERPAPKVVSFGGPGSPHYCIGGALAKVLMKTTLATLLREYRLGLDPRQSRKYTMVPEEVPKSKVVVRSLEAKRAG